MENGGVESVAATILLLAATLTGGVCAQEPLDISHFDGWRNWPLYHAGDLEVDTRGLEPQRTVFDFRLPAGNVLRMHIDLLTDMRLRGRPTLWVQYLSSGVAGDTAATSTLDALPLDRESFRIAFRIQGVPGPRSWTGPYAFVQHRPDRIIGAVIADDGTVETEELDQATNPFDFAAMPYLIPFLDLEEADGIRLLNVGARGARAPREVALKAIGPATITDPPAARTTCARYNS